MTRRIGRFGWLAGLLVLAACQPQRGESAGPEPVELRVITSGGFTAALDVLVPAFEARTGVEIAVEYGASSGGADTSIPVRLARGERFDVIILADYSMDRLVGEGYVDGTTRRDVARSRIGMAVREGAPKPDIGTPGAFIEAVRAADSFGYSASASGTYLSTDLFPRLGLWEEFGPKGRRIVGERVGAVVARGEVAIGFQQISELLPIEGVDFVGPIPEAFQRVTVYAAGITPVSEHRREAAALLDSIGSPAVADAIAATGLEPVDAR